MIPQVIAFVAGTVLTSRVPVLLPLESCLILVPLLGYGLRTRLSLVCALLLGAALSFCALKVELQQRQSLNFSGEVQTVIGVIQDLPLMGEHSQRFIVELENSQTRVRLYWFQTEVAVEAGERWQFQVRLKSPTGAVNFQAFDFEQWLFSNRIHGLGHIVPDAEQQRLASTGNIDQLRHRLKHHLAALIPEDALATFLALSIGDTSLLSPADWQTLNRTGTTHLLIVSGLHIGLVATLVFALCRTFGCRQAVSAILTAACAAIYAVVAGWGLPVQRALVMTLVYLGCGLLGRNIPLLSRLAIAAVFVLTLDPLANLSPGFWLSFGVVSALVLGLSNRGAGSLKKVKSVWDSQWVAFLSLLPLLAGFNHQLPLAALLVNLIAIPLVGLVLVPLIFLSLVVAVIFERFGEWLIHLCSWITRALWQFLEFAASSGWLVQIVAPEFWQLALALLGAVIILLPQGLLPRWLGIPMLLVMLLPSEPLPPGRLRVTFFDVGQGLSVLLETHSAVTLYDTGPAFPGGFSAAEQIVLPAIRSRGWNSLSELIISHTDNDHAGGKGSVLEALPVGRLIEQTNCHAEWQRDGFWFYSFDVEGSDSENDNSCLLLMVAGERRLLLTGDIEQSGEYALLRRIKTRQKASLPIDLLSVPHHGSGSSSSPAFINAFMPQIAVVSSGYANRFGHPHRHITDRYEARSVRLLQTDKSGAIEIMIEPHGMMVRRARDEPGGLWRRRDP